MTSLIWLGQLTCRKRRGFEIIKQMMGKLLGASRLSAATQMITRARTQRTKSSKTVPKSLICQICKFIFVQSNILCLSAYYYCLFFSSLSFSYCNLFSYSYFFFCYYYCLFFYYYYYCFFFYYCFFSSSYSLFFYYYYFCICSYLYFYYRVWLFYAYTV